jgi:hypothetical protein
MRRELWMVTLLLPLSGCYVPPADQGYGYAPAEYYPPGYPGGGYGPAPYQSAPDIYPGYSYNDGQPTYLDGGMAVPLVLFGGQWGYYDRERRWHHAPDRISRDLEAHRAGGGHFHTNSVPRGEPGFQPRPGQPGGFRPPEQPRSPPPQAGFQPRPAAPQAAFPAPEQPRSPPPQAGFQPRPAAPQAAFQAPLQPRSPPPQAGFQPRPAAPQAAFQAPAPPRSPPPQAGFQPRPTAP